MEQGHVNWSLMGHRPFSIYHLMLQIAHDRTPDGIQMWRGFSWTFSCSEFPKQLFKPRFIAMQTALHTVVYGESTTVLGLQPRKGQQRKEIYRRVYIPLKSGNTQSSDTVSSSISKISTAIGVVNICPISSQGLFSWVFVPCFLLSFFLFKEKFPVLIKLKLLAAWLVFNSFLPFFLPYCLSEEIFSKQSHRVFISTL